MTAAPGSDTTNSHRLRQEFSAGEAEDMMKVNSIGGKLTVPAGSYVDVLTTREWSPLEPTVLEVEFTREG